MITLDENNFELAGQCLAEVWSSFTLDTFPVVSEYIPPNESEMDAEQIISKDEVWMQNHVRTSQYFTQIVKCNDRSCCKQPRSSYFNFFPRFFPPPIPIIQSERGLIASPDPCNERYSSNFCSIFVSNCLNFDQMLPQKFKEYLLLIPYDLYCPSVQYKLKSLICNVCGTYFASIVMLTAHTKAIHQKVISSPMIRPIRIVAKRQNEIMAIVAINEVGDEDCEWIDVENIAVEESALAKMSVEQNYPTPVVTMEQHFNKLWEEEIM